MHRFIYDVKKRILYFSGYKYRRYILYRIPKCYGPNQQKAQKIIKKANCSIPLTSNLARHSWATIAKRSGISTAIISESLGHETEEITQVYLDSFENADLDEANRKIIGLI